jgi:hypothetical protein
LTRETYQNDGDFTALAEMALLGGNGAVGILGQRQG